MKRIGLLVALALCLPSLAEAATLSLSRTTRPVTAEEIADGAPMGGYVHEFFVNSDTDLLAVGADPFGASFFHHTLGSDVAPPSPEDLPGRPSLGVDTYITLPGETLKLGGAFSSAPGERGWGDLSKDGPQQNFRFARFTTKGEAGAFTGRILARGYNGEHDGFVSLPFSFALPAAETELALLDSEPTYSLEYSLDSPPAPIPPPVVPESVPITPSIPEPLPVPPEVPIVVPPTPADPPVVESPPVPEQPPASNPPVTPTEPEAPVALPEPPIYVIQPGFGIDFTYVHEITPISIGWNHHWRLTGDLLNPTLIDLTTFDGGLKITDPTELIDLTSVVTTGELHVTSLYNTTRSLFAADGADLASATAADSQVPEPSTALLAAAAVLALSAARRR
jgi:hypothetical protein